MSPREVFVNYKAITTIFHRIMPIFDITSSCFDLGKVHPLLNAFGFLSIIPLDPIFTHVLLA